MTIRRPMCGRAMVTTPRASPVVEGGPGIRAEGSPWQVPGITLAMNQTYLMLFQFDASAGTTSAWVLNEAQLANFSGSLNAATLNAATMNTESPTGIAWGGSVTSAGAIGSLSNLIMFGNLSTDGTFHYTWDEIRISNTNLTEAVTAAAVPEPSTIAALGFGLGALALRQHSAPPPYFLRISSWGRDRRLERSRRLFFYPQTLAIADHESNRMVRSSSSLDRSLVGCLSRASIPGSNLGYRTLHPPGRSGARDQAEPRFDVLLPHAREVRELGVHPHIQSRGDRSGWKDSRDLPRRGRSGKRHWRLHLTAWPGSFSRWAELHPAARSGPLPRHRGAENL